MKRTIAACAITALAVGGGSATAATLITGKDVKNGSLSSVDVRDGSLRAKDIKKNSISLNRLSPGSQALLRRAGTPGAAGKPGSNGANGANGANGSNGAAGAPGEPGTSAAAIDDDGQTTVTSAGQGFEATNSRVRFSDAGAVFGPFANNSQGGSIYYPGANGKTLKDLAEVTYSATLRGTADNGDAPYLRVFTDAGGGNENSLIFNPSTQPGACKGPNGGDGSSQCTRNLLIKYDVHDGFVRYNDDPGSGGNGGAGDPFEAIVADHADEVITGIYVTSGFSQGETTGGTLNSLRLEVAGDAPQTFSFSE